MKLPDNDRRTIPSTLRTRSHLSVQQACGDVWLGKVKNFSQTVCFKKLQHLNGDAVKWSVAQQNPHADQVSHVFANTAPHAAALEMLAPTASREEYRRGQMTQTLRL